MRNGKVLLLAVTVLLLALLGMAVLAGQRDIPADAFLGVQIDLGDREEKIASWYDIYNGVVYVFLPSGTQLDRVRLLVYEDGEYAIDGEPIVNGMSCAGYETDVAYSLTRIGRDWEERIVFLQSGNVPSLFLDTRSGTMDHIHEDKEHGETGMGRIYGSNGFLELTVNLNKISGRGQSSWNEEKKSYNLSLAQEADLLGLGAAENWVLQSNAKDPSNLRNKLIYDFAGKAGMAYSPDSAWVDLYLNGEYAGLYLLCEKIEIHPNRVDISKEGSFLVSKDGQWRLEAQGEPYVQTRENTALEIRYSDLSHTQLQQLWQSVENAIMAEDGTDPVTGKSWQQLIDVDSWVKKHLLEEVFANQDAMMLSQYYYMDGSREDGLIYSGPVWDYDLTMRKPADMIYAIRPNNYGTLWPPALYAKELYYTQLVRDYETLFRPMVQELIDSGIESYAAFIAQAANMNAARWYIEDPQSECGELCSFLEQRLAFLDALWLSDTEFVMVQTLEPDGVERYYGVPAGSTLEWLAQFEDTATVRYCGWYDVQTEEKADLTKPLYEDIFVYMKTEQIPHTEEATARDDGEEIQEPLKLSWLFPPAALTALLLALAAAEYCRQRRSP